MVPVTLILLLCLLLAATAYVLDEQYINLATLKRSPMDMAMMQMYRICDQDKNGLFTRLELQCVQKVLNILFTGR